MTSRVTTLFWMTWDGTSSKAIVVLRWTRRERIYLWLLSFHLTYVLYAILFTAKVSLVPKRLSQCKETTKSKPLICNKTSGCKTATWLLFTLDSDLREGEGYIDSGEEYDPSCVEGKGWFGGQTLLLHEVHHQELALLILWGKHYDKATPTLRDTQEGWVDRIWKHKQNSMVVILSL